MNSAQIVEAYVGDGIHRMHTRTPEVTVVGGRGLALDVDLEAEVVWTAEIKSAQAAVARIEVDIESVSVIGSIGYERTPGDDDLDVEDVNFQFPEPDVGPVDDTDMDARALIDTYGGNPWEVKVDGERWFPRRIMEVEVNLKSRLFTVVFE